MSFYPDAIWVTLKEVVLERSPFTKAFLEPNPLDPKEWSARLISAEDQLDAQLEAALGTDYSDIYISQLTTVAQKMHIFHEDLPPRILLRYVKSIVGIGFEINNQKDCGPIFNDLIDRLTAVGVIDKEAFSHETLGYASNRLLELLDTGIHCHHLPKVDTLKR